MFVTSLSSLRTSPNERKANKAMSTNSAVLLISPHSDVAERDAVNFL
jgi:hypothetical protein